MNKKYKVDEENNIIVLTDTKEIQRKDKYSNNTEEILSLENASEALESKIYKLEYKLNELNEEKSNNKNNIIVLTIMLICFIMVSLLATGKLFLIKIISILGTVFGITISTITVKKLKTMTEEIKRYTKMIDEQTNRKTRINKRIETLIKNKIIVPAKKTNEYIEIKSTYDFNFTPTDFFIENYQITKRANEMTNGKKKTKKRTITSTHKIYKF